MALVVGKKAPKFLLQDKEGERRSLESFGTDRMVLFFYPKDDTPGCTVEALEFSGHISAFKQQGVAVVGISGGDNRSKAKFCAKHKLVVPLLSDSDFAVSEAYGVYGEKSFMGRTYKGIHRTTFIINTKSGLIERVYESVKPEGHAEEVLRYLSGAEKKLAPERTQPSSKAKRSSVTKKPSGATAKRSAMRGKTVKSIKKKR